MILLAERFWSKVDKTGECWVWTASTAGKGYGKLDVREEGKRVTQLAHRMSWVFTYGSIPQGMWVLHKCDTPLCVKPTHLVLGTPKDNVDDMIRKGRQGGGFTGRKHSRVTRMQMSISHQGKPSAMRGRKHSEATRRKISEALQGNTHLLGKSPSAASRQKMSIAQKRRRIAERAAKEKLSND